METRPSPPDLLVSTAPLLHCCETWHVRAREGEVIPNLPKEPETWAAIRAMQEHLLRPLEEHFGVVTLTYGFAGPQLLKAIQARATQGGWLPNITPAGDQHCGHELNSRGTRRCKRDGIAVDLRVPGEPTLKVVRWVMDNLPFDRIYQYDDARPFHLSWAPEPLGQLVQMSPGKNGGLYPRVLRRGRGVRSSIPAS